MSSRSGRRRQHKTVQRLATLAEQQRQAEAQALLVGWQREARRRADRLAAPKVWQLAHNPNIQAQAAAVDPTGELQQTLEVVCGQAIANVADHRMLCSSRPVGGKLRSE